MNYQEALLFFPCTENDDLFELYEEKIFEYKQFFISKIPIKKVFLAKEKKMLQMNEAYMVISKNYFNLNNSISNSYTLTKDILDCFNLYQKHKNELKIKLSICSNALEISEVIHFQISLEELYIEEWAHSFQENETSTEGIILSKEPDPMTLLNAIKEFNLAGGITFEDIRLKRNISPELLINESKRLSLYRKL